MHHHTLTRTLEANRFYYEQMFEAMRSPHERTLLERKQLLTGLYREVAAMESHLQSLEQAFFGSAYRPAWCVKTSAFDFVGAIAYGRTLLVGEGNFSFAASLVSMTRIIPSRLTATTLEPESELSPLAEGNVQRLRARGARVICSVDAADLAAAFGSLRFDNIVFQFPHVGSREPVEGHNPNFILVRDFLLSAVAQLAPGGQAVDSPHYEGAFQFDEAAEIAGFLPPEVYPFDPSDFPDYTHAMTHQEGDALDNHDAFSTWVFKRA